MATYKSDGLRISTYANGTPGTAGKGISNIENYYYAATTENISEIPAIGNAAWKTAISQLIDKPFNETNKYLWNYELITYTDNTSSDTGRVMIAVYSSDGEDGRGISDILEFYILTEDNNAPLNLPTDTNDNGWVNSPIPMPSSDYPYLWNYEIVDYTDGTDTTFGPTCIGTYGNSITEVKEYYMATAANIAPTSYTDSRWKETVSEAGQGATKPYLWNYEKTSYSISGDKYTPITLLSASNREIETVTEYYQQLAYDSTSTPSGATWTDTNHNTQPTIPTDWGTTRAALEAGKIMWNMEVIKYAAVDGEGKNLYVATPPAQVGYAGTNGTNGRGINSTTIHYAVTDTLVNPSNIVESDWKTQENMPSASPEQYLWTRTVIDYTEGEDSVSYTYSYQGKTGAAGSSVTVKEIKYQQGDSATTTPTGTWTTAIPAVDQGKYLWTRTTYSDDTKSYGVSYQSVDGSHAQDFNITADSYVLKKSSPTATTYTNQITLTAHKMNITGDVKWYQGSTTGSILNTANTYTVTSPGTYYAVCGKWSDSVTIGEVTDGEIGPDGKPAIAITLSNPSMTFHAQTANEVEYCEIIVYEGGEQLSYATSGTGTFLLTKKTDTQGKASIDNGKIKISDPSDDGSAVFTVTVRPKSGAAATSHDYTVYWKVVSNGPQGNDGPKGDTTIEILLFHVSSQTNINSLEPILNDNGTINEKWLRADSNDESELENSLNEDNPYLYRAYCLETITYADADDQVGTSTYSVSKKPELYKAWNSLGVEYTNYAEYLKLTNFNKANGLYYGNDGQLHVIADSLRVNKKDSTTDVLFFASADSNEVTISGWEVTTTELKTKDSTLGSSNTLYLCATGSNDSANIAGSGAKTGWVIASGANFGVTREGFMYATKGKIGGWQIEAKSLSNKVTKNGKTYGAYMSGQITAQFNGTTQHASTAFAAGEVPWEGTAESGYWAWYKAPFNVNNIGEMTATKGQIAGWKILGGCLTNDPNQNGQECGITLRTRWKEAASNGSDLSIYDYPAISCGWTGNSSNGKFMVFQDGTVTATSGTVGGWTLHADGIYDSSTNGQAGLYCGDDEMTSLINVNNKSKIKFFTGYLPSTNEVTKTYENMTSNTSSKTVTLAVTFLVPELGNSNNNTFAIKDISFGGPIFKNSSNEELVPTGSGTIKYGSFYSGQVTCEISYTFNTTNITFSHWEAGNVPIITYTFKGTPSCYILGDGSIFTTAIKANKATFGSVIISSGSIIGATSLSCEGQISGNSLNSNGWATIAQDVTAGSFLYKTAHSISSYTYTKPTSTAIGKITQANFSSTEVFSLINRLNTNIGEMYYALNDIFEKLGKWSA